MLRTLYPHPSINPSPSSAADVCTAYAAKSHSPSNHAAFHSMWQRKTRALGWTLALAAVIGMAGCGKSGDAPGGAGGSGGGAGGGMPPPEVSVITVQAQGLPVEMEYTGQTAGSRETEVRARVSGILEKRLYEEGSFVRAGTPLFQIDPATFQNQLAASTAAVAVAQARVNQTKRDHARLAPLAQEKAVSQKELDDSTSALESAQAALQQAQAQAAQDRLNLSYTKVLAPISGTTGVASKSEGSLVTTSDSLLTTMVQTQPLYVNFSVSESDYLRMREQVQAGILEIPGKRAANGSLGFTVKLKLANGSIFPHVGTLNFASERVNPQTGSFDVRAQIPNPEGTLRPGQFVRVLLSGATRLNTISVPQRAVIDSPVGKIVFVVTKENKLEPHPVELDGWSQGQWIVTKGLQAGDSVLVEGFIKAHDPGMVVKPVPYVASATTTPNTAGAQPSAPAQAPAPAPAPASTSAPAAAK